MAVKSRLLPGENTVRIRGGPPISMLPYLTISERDASNVAVAGESPAGSANFAALAQLPEALRSERRGRGWKSLTRHHFAHVVQRRDGALKTRTVPVRIRPWAPPRVAQSEEAFRSNRKGCRCKSCHADQFALNRNRAPVVLVRGSAGW